MSNPEIILHLEITQLDLENARNWLSKLRAGLPQARAPRPFLLITPYGMALRERIMEMLGARHIPIGRRMRIADFPRASTAIYAKTLDDERLRVALGFEALWRAVSISQTGERWDIENPEDYARMTAARAKMRTALGQRKFKMHIPGIKLRTPAQIVRLQAFHVPDPGSLDEESRLLDVYLLGNSSV